MDGAATSFVLAAAMWLPLSGSGAVRKCARRLSQELFAVDWLQILFQHFRHLPFPADDTLRWLQLSTVQAIVGHE